jgi:hypothetical protein
MKAFALLAVRGPYNAPEPQKGEGHRHNDEGAPACGMEEKDTSGSLGLTY